MATTVIGRPKTLEESKDYLRHRLAERHNPMIAQDAEAASAAIDRLESLDPDHWADVCADVGARFEEDRRGGTIDGPRFYFRDPDGTPLEIISRTRYAA